MRGTICMMILAAALALPVSTVRAELVVNGGFETGDFTGWGTQAAAAGSSFGVSATAHSGSSGVFFAAVSNEHDWIFQELPTEAGKSYLLSFWVHNLALEGDSLLVYWEGNEELNLTPVGTELENWVEITHPLQATMNGSELRFGGYDGPLVFDLDDISVTLVPEPATAALLALGGLALLRRRTA